MDFIREPSFEKDCKSLQKKFRSLSEDLATVEAILTALPAGPLGGLDQIPDLGVSCIVFKLRVMSRDLRKKDLRLIYCYDKTKRSITLIELYFKGSKETEDRGRIKYHASEHQFE